jgi:hypothetical protein
MNQLEKLPQARRYLRAARWGLNTMLEQKVLGAGYIFYVTGLLATLRSAPCPTFWGITTTSSHHSTKR